MSGQNTIEKKAFWAKYNGEKRKGFGKIHRKTKSFIGQNTIEKEGILRQNTMEKSVKVSAKYIQKKCMSGQNTMAKNYIWGKMQWRKRRGFGKIHTKKMHLGKIQWPKITFWAKCNGESVKVSAKYIQKNACLGKIQ